MRSLNYKGISLVEILIAFSIFVIIGAMFITFLQSSSRAATFSNELFNAVVLSQKVSEDILEELSVNPYGLETLGIQNNTSVRSLVVNRESVFFSYFEDRVQPHGFINPEKDGGIDSNVQPLYDSVKDFNFEVTGRRLAASGNSPNRNLLTCDVSFLWNTRAGRGRYETSLKLFSPVTLKEAAPMIAIDEALIDSRIAAEIFRTSDSIGEIAAESGENAATIIAIGRIALIARDFLNSPLFRSQSDLINQQTMNLNNLAANDIDGQFKTNLELGFAWYELAKYCYQIIIVLEPQFTVLQQQGRFTALTSGTGMSPIVFELSLTNFQIIYEYFVAAILYSRHHFYNLLAPEIVALKGNKTQLHAIQKLIDLYRLTAILETRPGSMNEYRDFLWRLESLSENRNPFLQRMIVQELSLLTRRVEWLERYPNLGRLERILGARIPEILAFIKNTRTAIINEALQSL